MILRRQRTWYWAAALVIALGLSSIASAQQLTDASDLEQIRARLARQEAEIQELRGRLEAQPRVERLPSLADQVQDGSMVVPAGLLQEEPPGIPLPGAPRKQPPPKEPAKDSKDAKKTEYPIAKMTGFTQLDSAWYSQSPNNRATVGDAQDGVGFRRARVAVAGKVTDFTNFLVEMDFATAGRPSFFDVWGEQTNLPFFGAIRVGQYVQPFSVDSMSGFRNLPFLERSLPFLAFVPFRRVGVETYNATEDQNLTWAVSVFKTGGYNNAPLGDDRYSVDIGDKGGYSLSTRVVWLTHYDEPADGRYLFHVGGSFDYSRLGQNTAAGSGTAGNAGGGPSPFYQSKVLPEFGALGYPENSQSFGSAVNATPTFVDSGRYAANSFQIYGLENVWQYGSVSFQAEWMATVVNSVVGNIFYNGAYAEVMWRPTGEHRVYDKQTGVFKNPIPFSDFIPLGRRRGIGAWGAFELAARLSYVNEINPTSLNGHYYDSATNTYTGSAGRVGNGHLTNTTLGMSWFLNKHTKIQFNWIHSMLDNVVKGYSTADLFVSRFQIDW